MDALAFLIDFAQQAAGFVTGYVLPFLAVLTAVVFVHELGHYAVARRNGVRVEVFSVGFGREIFGWTDRVGTRWKISAVPLGGYVKMFGEYDGEDGAPEERVLTPEERAVSFHYKSVGQRAAIVSAGPAANFLFAVVVLAGLYSTVGSEALRAVVGEVRPGSAAAEAGLLPGDRFLSIGGEEVVWFEDLRRIVSASAGVPLTIVVSREDRQVVLQATPKRVLDDAGVEIGRLGITADPTQVAYERHDPLSATWMAVERTANLVKQIMVYLGQLIAGTRSGAELRGPLGIAKMSGDICEGGAVRCILFAAALSVNLGLINLFPIPMLDGGHLIFCLAEAVRRRPLDRRLQEYGFRFGLILVIMLFLFATWNDLVDLNVLEFFRRLVT